MMKDLTTVVVSDGPICARAYANADLKVLHLLKEPTKSLGIGRNLMEQMDFATGDVKWRIWRVTARRSAALMTGLPAYDLLDRTKFAQSLTASAILNLNNTLPRGVESRFNTNNAQCLEHAKLRWSDDRRPTILRLAPDIVICGGTFEMIKNLFDHFNEIYKSHVDSMEWYNIKFIYACHPSFPYRKHAEEYEEFRQRCLRATRR